MVYILCRNHGSGSILFCGVEVQICGFNTKCRPLGCMPLKRHNFSGAIVLNVEASKLERGYDLPGGI